MKVSPTAWNVIVGLMATASISMSALSLTGDVTFGTDNTHDVGSQTARAAEVHTANLYAGNVSGTALNVGDAGTSMDGIYSGSVSVNPDSVPGHNATSVDITVTGVVEGDTAFAGRTAGDVISSTSTFFMEVIVTATDTVRVYLRNTSGTAMDAGASTLRAWAISL